jgi:hypothetical protein
MRVKGCHRRGSLFRLVWQVPSPLLVTWENDCVIITAMDLVRSLSVTAFCAISFISLAQQSPALPNQEASESVARLIGVQSEISQLHKLSASTAPADRWQILWLHQYISEQVMAASLQVDATNAEIDNEIARANELRGYLADHRDRTVSRDNLLRSNELIP